MKTEFLKSILLEQACLARKYVEHSGQIVHRDWKAYLDSIKPTPIRKGFFGVIKGDTVTYQDPNGTVTTKKLDQV